MNACWYQRLTVVVCRKMHLSQIQDEVTNMTEELILVDIPLRTASSSVVLSAYSYTR